MRNLKGLGLVLFMAVSFTSLQANDTLIINSNTEITDIAVALDSLFGDVQVITSRDDFPPKDAQGWILLLFAALPFISKALVSGTRIIGMFKGVFDGTSTTSIVFGVGMGLAAIYEGVVSGWAFSFQDWGGYATLIIGFSMIIHETYKKIFKKETAVA